MKKTALQKAEHKAWQPEPRLPTEDKIKICPCGEVQVWSNGIRNTAHCLNCKATANYSVGSKWVS